MRPIEAVRWSAAGDAVRIIDQTRLPAEFVERDLREIGDLRDAIRTLAVRGAPAIGVAAAMGLAVAMAPHHAEAADDFARRLREGAATLRAARPTAVNLAWAIDRMLRRAERAGPAPAAIVAALRTEAEAIRDEDIAMCRRIGDAGAPLLAAGARVLTICNAGALATAGIGTALAPVYVAAAAGRSVHVTACETRPLLQGARLTAWELQRAGIPVRVIADGAAASLMRAGEIDLCLAGADRIAANGDSANKIGTYAIAVLARHHGIPFYIAAPTSTLDARCADGAAIVIEQRARDELSHVAGRAIMPDGVPVANPAFDVTPAALITAIITDRGLHRPPFAFRDP